jgi:hypothetical protein
MRQAASTLVPWSAISRTRAARRSWLTTEQIAVLAAETPAVELAVSAGTVLALRPLLVHGSRRRTTQGHRRILHVEIAAGDPPPPLEWAWA